MKKFIKSAIILIVICFGAVALKANLTTNALAVEVIEIQPKQVIDSFKEDGTVKHGDNFKQLSNVEGQLLQTYINENDYIEQGTTIAVIDSSSYETQKVIHQNNISSHEAKIAELTNSSKIEQKDILASIAKLNGDIEAIENKRKTNEVDKEQKLAQINKSFESSSTEQIKILELALETAQKNYDYDKLEYSNTKSLYDIGAVSKEQLDSCESKLISSQNDVNKAKAELDIKKSDIEKLYSEGKTDTELNELFYQYQNEDFESSINSLKAQIEMLESKSNLNTVANATKYYEALIQNEKESIKQLDNKIESCDIKAKASGYIISLPVKQQSIINYNDLVCTIKAKNNFTVDVGVLTNSVPYLKVNDEVKVIQQLKSEDIIYKGVIKEIYDFATESISTLGLNETRVNVIVEIKEENINLKDGYEVEVEFDIYNQNNKLSVPNSAIFKINENDFVYKVEDNKAVLAKVMTEYKTNEETVISSGIEVLDKIISNPNIEGLVENCDVSIKQ